MFVTAVAATMVTSGPSANWVGANLGLMLVDLAYFVGLYVLAVRTHRYWAIWCGGFQLLAFVASLAVVFEPTANPKLYRGLESVWAVPLLLVMARGLWLDRRAGLIGKPAEQRYDPAARASDQAG